MLNILVIREMEIKTALRTHLMLEWQLPRRKFLQEWGSFIYVGRNVN
jgi:hypothetical protein